MKTVSDFALRIRPYVRAELEAAAACEARGEPEFAFTRLERAHILGQASTVEHVRVHWAMLGWARRQNDTREVIGQACRVVAAALMTAFGWVPKGNPGGARVSAFRRMTVPLDLQRVIDAAAFSGTP